MGAANHDNWKTKRKLKTKRLKDIDYTIITTHQGVERRRTTASSKLFHSNDKLYKTKIDIIEKSVSIENIKVSDKRNISKYNLGTAILDSNYVCNNSTWEVLNMKTNLCGSISKTVIEDSRYETVQGSNKIWMIFANELLRETYAVPKET